MITMKKLDIFWRHSNCPTHVKIHVADAVLRAKLLYGLESAQLNPAVVKRLETFQLKVLRQILRMDTTYVDRTNTNELVFKRANEQTKEEKEREGKPHKKNIVTFIEAYKKQKRKRALQIIRKPSSAIHRISFNGNKLMKWTHRNRRVGRPRLNWTEETIREIWEYIKTQDNRHRYTAFDENHENIIKEIKDLAWKERTHDETE